MIADEFILPAAATHGVRSVECLEKFCGITDHEESILRPSHMSSPTQLRPVTGILPERGGVTHSVRLLPSHHPRDRGH